MKKWKKLLLMMLLLPVFGLVTVPDGEGGGSGDGGDTGDSGDTGDIGLIEVEIDGKKYRYTAKEITKLHKDLHTTKSQLGDTKKTLADLENKGKSELEVLQGQHTELEGNYKNSLGSNRLLMLEIEASKQGLEMEDAQEILLEDNDTRESIAKKVKEKKAKLDKRVEEIIKERGYSGSILKPGASKDKAKEVIDSIYGEKQESRKPRYEF